jgi:hypothetical protein
MGNRIINRTMAHKLYEDFSKQWRRQKRLAGQYGKPSMPRPTFNQWYAMHERDVSMMSESSPNDVREYLGADPWAEPVATPTVSEPKEERGVMTIPISGDDDE